MPGMGITPNEVLKMNGIIHGPKQADVMEWCSRHTRLLAPAADRTNYDWLSGDPIEGQNRAWGRLGGHAPRWDKDSLLNAAYGGGAVSDSSDEDSGMFMNKNIYRQFHESFPY